MTDFRASLRALGHTQRSFAEYVGVDERSVGRWARGEQEIPRWVSVILELMAQTSATPTTKSHTL